MTDVLDAVDQTINRWSSVISLEFRKEHLDSDLAMIQCRVPMGRDSSLDLIRINNCPYELSEYDTDQLEMSFKKLIGV